MWRAYGNQNTCTNLEEILHTHPRLYKEGFGAVLTLHHPWPAVPETLKTEGNIFEKCYKKCSAGC